MAGSHSVYRLPRQDRDRPRRAAVRPHRRSGPARHLSFGPDMARGTVTIVLSGELDFTAGPALADHLAGILARRPRNLIFDMTRVGFLDCAAARLIAGTRWSLPGRRRPVLRGAGPEAVRLLELTGLAADCEIAAPREHRGRSAMP